MNPVIERHFDEVELRLIESPVVQVYRIVRREVAPADGKLRIEITLEENDFAELFEYVSEVSGTIQLLKYSFHWQDAEGNLKRRWDNAPHRARSETGPSPKFFKRYTLLCNQQPAYSNVKCSTWTIFNSVSPTSFSMFSRRMKTVMALALAVARTEG